MIIAPDPVIREADIHQEHKQPQTLNDTEIQRYVEASYFLVQILFLFILGLVLLQTHNYLEELNYFTA